MNALSSQQLSPLYRHEVFRSRHADETHARVTAELKAHRSRWGRGSVDAAFFRARTGPMSLCILRYGCEVEIEPDALDSFVLVQMPLRGRAEVHIGREVVQIHAGQGAVISAHRPVKVHWHAGCEQLLLKIERSHLDAVAREAFATPSGPISRDIEFDTPLRLDDAVGRQWRWLVAGLAGSLPAPGHEPCDAGWLRAYEDNLLHYLLRHHPNSALARDRATSTAPPQADGGATLAPLLRAEEFMRNRCGESQSLDDIALAAGVSRRTLCALFRRHRAMSPMETLRNLRLDAAHALLARPSAGSVTDVALRCGFAHLSRFAASYRERFGQLPHETWRGAQRLTLHTPPRTTH
ncbi:AraC family transcriptional regulator [Variovorax ginsengisoli]|uniref:AraC-like DNA-binding protein n=1 Tax=Variovorax ginsengisoli TaxID=363844 RepID=A0ABT9S2Z9_9BURK|nr:AraC family transcriptional regulator [Variovorax ginsengisoli]MDP9898156.1 AraC-like DNA-binding protein [Variovorax ginsengisoli]